MISLMWVLVLVLNPESFNEPYRTKSNLEIVERAFYREQDCLLAKAAMERGISVSASHELRYECVHDEAVIPSERKP